jgi:signal transduction histidine kinase/ligand-binding sensor domain-containing protein/DNA-binding response OmpR family regulator
MKKFYFIFLILQICSFNCSEAQERIFKFTHITVNEGLSHIDANNIVQDSKGFLWIATYSGLNKYDGYDIKKYFNSQDKFKSAYTNRIFDMCIDPISRIWLATEGGIQCFDAVREKFISIHQSSNDSKSVNYISFLGNNVIVAYIENHLVLYRVIGDQLVEIKITEVNNWRVNTFFKDKKDNLWVSLANGFLGLITPKLTYRKIQIIETRIKVKSQFSVVYIAKDDRIYAASQNSIYKSNISSRQILESKITKINGICFPIDINPNATVKGLVQDSKDAFWLGTSRGLLRMDAQLNVTDYLTIDNNRFTNLTSEVINNVIIDRSGCLWISTFGGGANVLDINAKNFYSIQKDIKSNNTLSENHIRALIEEDGQKLWIATDTKGLDCYDFRTKLFQHYCTSTIGNTKLQSNNLRSLVMDKTGNLWIGSVSGIEILKKDRNSIEKLSFGNSGMSDLINYEISSLSVDRFNQVWVGSWNNGLSVIRNKGNSSYQILHFEKMEKNNKGISSNRVTYVYADPLFPRVFVATDEGLDQLVLDPKGNIIKYLHYKGTLSKNSFSSNYIWPIESQGENDIWVGTLGGGLNHLKLKRDGFEVNPINDNTGTLNDVESLLIDHNRNVWIGGNGLYMYSTRSHTFLHYDVNDGLQGNSFKVGAACKGVNNRLYFGGTNGVNYFNPDSIKLNNILAHPIITDILINNQSMKVNETDESNGIKKAVSYVDYINLNHLQNNFIIRFSATHYANPNKCKYRYMLIGFDKNWNYCDASIRSAAYSNLNYDNYKFKLEASNNDGIWNKNGTELTIKVTAPWWNTLLAKIIYALFVLLILVGVYYYISHWYKLKKKLELQQFKEEEKEKNHQMQLQFFTNISHEFRTPLTLIAGSLERLIKEDKSSLANYYHSVQKNVQRLMNLVNELMDFRKVEIGKIQLHVQKGNINLFITEIKTEFQDLADQKHIDIKINFLEDDIEVFFDHQVLEKILVNLIHNAFKYSKDNTLIRIELFLNYADIKPRFNNSYILKNSSTTTSQLFIKVSDNGIGISKESIQHIFDRYYRVEDSHIGSGIGLALVKSLTLLHKGDIYVFSEQNQGTDMVIAIPFGEHNYSDVEKAISPENYKGVNLESLQLNKALEKVTNENENEAIVKNNPNFSKQSILIVDDEEEIRNFLRSFLSGIYNISEAENGKDGLEKIKDQHPDMIISDVMMPEMNGNEFCQNVKNDIDFSHIPFVMLTAQTDLPAKLGGVESGADFYFSKPISTELLLLTIRNIFDQREKIKDHYLKNYNVKERELVHNKRDRDFIEQLVFLIQANLENEEMDIDMLCKNLAMSHSKLYQKIKSISGQTITEFTRTIRLRKAVEIMTHEDLQLSEVMYRVGIQSHSYFTRIFKKEFGKTPSQFLQDLEKK